MGDVEILRKYILLVWYVFSVLTWRKFVVMYKYNGSKFNQKSKN